MRIISWLLKKACFILLFLFSCIYILAQSSGTSRGTTPVSVIPADTLNGDTYAIIMGISNYPGVNPLKYADKDAILFSDFLQTPNGGNTKPENIKLLTNENAKMGDFWGAAANLQNKLKKGDRLYLYFSGHGVAQSDDKYYFLPYDCMPNKDENIYFNTGHISIRDVKEEVIETEVAKGVQVIFIMDACRSYDIPGGNTGQPTTGNNFIAEKDYGDIILLSTGPGMVSIESPTIGGGHGLYTYYLVDGLAGTAYDSLHDHDGKIKLPRIGEYVRKKVMDRASDEFNNSPTPQIPFYCCDSKYNFTVAQVDSQTYSSWASTHQINPGLNDVAMNTVKGPAGTKGIRNPQDNDTSQIRIYNQFVSALKNQVLTGSSSAETFYRQLETKWSGSSLTEDAKYSLASTYLNFGQEKINLFLGGKGLIQVIYMEKENAKKPTSNRTEIEDPGEQIKKLKTLVSTGFDQAAGMMQEAFTLLSDQPAFLKSFIPKLDFLKTMAAYADKNSKLKDVLVNCRTVIAEDPLSPAGYQLMGWIYQDLQDDSCAYYFNKAASMAPKWAYPMNGLGNYYIFRNDKKKAIQYFFRATQLDSLFASSYRNIATTYYNLFLAYPDQNASYLDSVKIYSRKALNIDSLDKYAYQNLGDANLAYVINLDFDGTSPYIMGWFNRAKGFYIKSISCDIHFVSGYQKLAALYSYGKNEDSALSVLQQCTALNPASAEAFRNLGKYYLSTRRDSVQAEVNFKKAISSDPADGDNYFLLARLYGKQGSQNKAISTLSGAMDKIGDNKNLYNEIGNIYFAGLQFDSATSYYNRALKTDSTLGYVYFNLGKMHGVKDPAKDSSIYFYSRAVFYDPDRFHKLNGSISSFYLKTLGSQTNSADLDRMITALINLGNLTDADTDLEKYLDPVKNKDVYERLSKKISDATQKN
jgi:tetratricopeptide (TPR) repeat protein